MRRVCKPYHIAGNKADSIRVSAIPSTHRPRDKVEGDWVGQSGNAAGPAETLPGSWHFTISKLAKGLEKLAKARKAARARKAAKAARA
jgi:hypothetical protein